MVQANGKNPVFIPIPYTLVLGGLKFLEAIGLKLRIRSDSLISMLNANDHPDFDSQIQKNIQFKEFDGNTL